MTEEEILNIIQETIFSKLAVEKSLILPTASITEDLGADSLDVVEITISLENAFNIDIPDDLEVIYINDLVKYIFFRINAEKKD